VFSRAHLRRAGPDGEGRPKARPETRGEPPESCHTHAITREELRSSAVTHGHWKRTLTWAYRGQSRPLSELLTSRPGVCYTLGDGRCGRRGDAASIFRPAMQRLEDDRCRNYRRIRR